MNISGAGAITALAFKTGIDVTERFARLKTVSAHVWLTLRKFNSDEIDCNGRISKSATPWCARSSKRPPIPC